jgi:hypothetical protein
MRNFIKRQGWIVVVLVGLLIGVLTGSATAAEIVGGETYRLPAGEVIEDDLYVGASEIYIDGTIEGDLIAAGGYIEINGTVTGDAIVAGGGIKLNGEVQDDVRAAGAGIEVMGTIGDDFVAAAGGGPGFMIPIQFEGQTVEPGIHLADNAQVGGDALLAGGTGDVAGTINGELQAGMGQVSLAGQVGEDARLYAGTVTIAETAQVAETLFYSSEEQTTIPPGVAADVEYAPPPQQTPPDPASVFLGWLIRTVLILAGFALLGWLLLRFVPSWLAQPANALAANPGKAGLYGLLATLAFIVLPLASILLVALMVLFWGWFPGIVLGLFLFGTLALIWFLSPLVTGLWLGRQLNLALGRAPDYLPILIGGILLLALLGRVPILGWLVYLVSFIFALGGLLLARRSGGGGSLRPVTESQPVTPSPTPAQPSRA